MGSLRDLQQPKMEKKLLQRKKGKNKGWVHAITYNNHNGEIGKCFEKESIICKHCNKFEFSQWL
jgi:hypothetical protein